MATTLKISAHQPVKPPTKRRHETRDGSEIKAFFSIPSHGITFDWDAALTDPQLAGLDASAPLESRTFFSGVRCVEPGQTLTFRAGPSGCPEMLDRGRVDWGEADSPFSSLEAELRGELERSISRSLSLAQHSAAPAILLSGGTDSAAIAAVGSKLGFQSCFTIDHETTRLSGDLASTSSLSRSLMLRTSAVDVVSRGWLSATNWRAILYQTETPVVGIDTLLKNQAVRAVGARGHRVLVSGTGADELAGGFASVVASEGQESSWAAFMNRARQMDRKVASMSASGGLWQWDRLLADSVVRFKEAEPQTDAQVFDAVRLGRLRDLAMYGLQVDDRIAAGNGIECRVPFLSRGVTRIFNSIPADRYAEVFWNKGFFRRALTGLLDTPWRERDKTPFIYSHSAANLTKKLAVELIAGSNYELLHEVVDGSNIASVLDVAVLDRAVRGLKVDASKAFPLLRLLNMGLLDAMSRDRRTNEGLADLPNSIDIQHLETVEAQKKRLTEGSIPAFAGNAVVLVDVRNPDASPVVLARAGKMHILGAKDAPSDEESKVARLIDGKRTIADLAAIVGTSTARVISIAETLETLSFITGDSESTPLDASTPMLKSTTEDRS